MFQVGVKLTGSLGDSGSGQKKPRETKGCERTKTNTLTLADSRLLSQIARRLRARSAPSLARRRRPWTGTGPDPTRRRFLSGLGLEP